MKKPANQKPSLKYGMMFILFALIINLSALALISYNFYLMEDATNEFTYSIYMLNCTIAYTGLMLANIKLSE